MRINFKRLSLIVAVVSLCTLLLAGNVLAESIELKQIVTKEERTKYMTKVVNSNSGSKVFGDGKAKVIFNWINLDHVIMKAYDSAAKQGRKVTADYLAKFINEYLFKPIKPTTDELIFQVKIYKKKDVDLNYPHEEFGKLDIQANTKLRIRKSKSIPVRVKTIKKTDTYHEYFFYIRKKLAGQLFADYLEVKPKDANLEFWINGLYKEENGKIKIPINNSPKPIIDARVLALNRLIELKKSGQASKHLDRYAIRPEFQIIPTDQYKWYSRYEDKKATQFEE